MMILSVVFWSLLLLSLFSFVYLVCSAFGVVPSGISPSDDRAAFYMAAGVFLASWCALLGKYT